LWPGQDGTVEGRFVEQVSGLEPHYYRVRTIFRDETGTGGTGARSRDRGDFRENRRLIG
jgi:hypothetical protein